MKRLIDQKNLQVADAARGRLLNLGEELELSRTIEAAEVAILEATAKSPELLSELARMCAELEEGTFTWDELLRVPPTEHEVAPLKLELRQAVNAVQRVRPAPCRKHTPESPSPRDTTLRQFVATFLPHRLSRKAVERLLSRLRAAPSRSRRLERTEILVERNLQNGERARARLVEANLRLVFWMAGKRLHHGLPKSDLVQERVFGVDARGREIRLPARSSLPDLRNVVDQGLHAPSSVGA